MLHPAEFFCRRMLAEYPKAPEQERVFLRAREKFGDAWPDWCGLPMSAVYAMMTEGVGVSVAASVMGSRVAQLPDLTAALLWTRAKVVYRFDPDLALALMSQTIDADDPVPMEIFYQLPHFCVYVEQPLLIAERPHVGFFAWMEFDVNSRTPELRLLFLDERHRTFSVPVIFSKDKTLDGSLCALQESAQLRSALIEPANLETLAQTSENASMLEVASALQLVLYLCSDQADVPELEASRRTAHAAARQPRSARPTQTVDVGFRVGAALRAARAAHPMEASESHIPTGAHPAPHVRRAHWHSFWMGAKGSDARRLTVRWLHPILVGATDREGLQTVVHPVKMDG